MTVTLVDGSTWSILGLSSGFAEFLHMAIPAFLPSGFSWIWGLCEASVITHIRHILVLMSFHTLKITKGQIPRSGIAGSKKRVFSVLQLLLQRSS